MSCSISGSDARARFREDLCFRLAAATVCLPALRDRKDKRLLVQRDQRTRSRYEPPSPCKLTIKARNHAMAGSLL